MMDCLFWLLALAAVYSYFVYPFALLILLGRIASKPCDTYLTQDKPLSATLIVTVHNEAGRIRKKIENSLAIDYSGNLEIIVASDHSSDETDDIVTEFAEQGVKLVRADQRLGKEYAQWCAINQAEGEVLIFSDASTEIPADAVEKMLMYFTDKNVGAVSSEDRFISQGGVVAGEGAYVRYEMWLRRMESRVAGLVGLSGSFFATRKVICENWDFHSPSDFNTALNCASAGKRAVTASDVLGYYPDLKDSSKEYQRKVRTTLRGMTAVVRHPETLNLFRYGLFSFQVWSHKVMRWLVPMFLLLLLPLNYLLLDGGLIYQAVFVGQILFYGTALVAHFSTVFREAASMVKIIYFFVQVNIALLDAGLRLITGKRMTVWKPSAR